MELRESLHDFDQILGHLGPHWDAIFTSPLRDPAGNHERACYVFNKKKVRHHRLASNAQAPRTKKGAEYLAQIGWWRLPYLAAFRPVAREDGDADLLLLTAHVRWGKSAAERQPELTLLADWIATEIAKDPYCGDRDVIVLGDFNIPSEKSPLMEAVRRRGLVIPQALLGTHGRTWRRTRGTIRSCICRRARACSPGEGARWIFTWGGLRGCMGGRWSCRSSRSR